MSIINLNTNQKSMNKYSLSEFYDNKENSDVTISHQKGEIFGHQILLKANSIVFKKMLNSGMAEENSKIIDLSNFSADAVETAIKFMYVDDKYDIWNHLSFPKKFADLEELIRLTDFLDIERLKDHITGKLMDKNEFLYLKFDFNSLISLALKYRLCHLYDLIAEHCKNNINFIKSLSLEDYLEVRKYFDWENIKYDIQWCSDHNDAQQMEIFLKDVNWLRVNTQDLKSITELPILKNHYILSLIDALCKTREDNTVKTTSQYKIPFKL